MNKCAIIVHITHTILLILFQLPITVCSYQSINYSIVIREELALEFLTFGPFTHLGSGDINYWVTSGLTRNKNYSLSVIVDTVVGDSETSTRFGKPSN